MFSEESERFNYDVLVYILSQYQSLVSALNIELKKVKNELRGKSPYTYLLAVA